MHVESMKEGDTHELNTTWQPLSLATDRLLSKTKNDPDKDQWNGEEKREKDNDDEFARITARLRFLNMIELAMQGSLRKRI